MAGSSRRTARLAQNQGSTSNTLDDNERYEVRKQEMLNQVRIAGQEKKKELSSRLRESISRERQLHLQSQVAAAADKDAVMRELRKEHNLRKEI